MFVLCSSYACLTISNNRGISPIKPYTNKRFRLSVSVADGKIISHQLLEMQNYSDNFIYQKDPKIYFFDDAV